MCCDDVDVLAVDLRDIVDGDVPDGAPAYAAEADAAGSGGSFVDGEAVRGLRLWCSGRRIWGRGRTRTLGLGQVLRSSCCRLAQARGLRRASFCDSDILFRWLGREELMRDSRCQEHKIPTPRQVRLEVADITKIIPVG